MHNTISGLLTEIALIKVCIYPTFPVTVSLCQSPSTSFDLISRSRLPVISVVLFVCFAFAFNLGERNGYNRPNAAVA